MSPIKLVERPAVSTTESTGFVTRSCCVDASEGPCLSKQEGFPCGIGKITIKNYSKTPEGEALRALRRELGITMGHAAAKLGIKVSEYSGLENGEYGTDWEEVRRRLRR